MGIYLNPGNENFAETVNAKIYVDKTMMIDVLKQNDPIDSAIKQKKYFDSLMHYSGNPALKLDM